jgi:aspartyl-tRNA(Asn)/glutamyl-tRNA(Gln) amidotransferase subunit A
MQNNLLNLSIEQVSNLIQDGSISSLELTETVLDNIRKLEPKLNAFIKVLNEESIEQAKKADVARAHGTNLGSLHGIPVAVKDLFATKNIPSTAGSKILSNWIPEQDASAVSKLKAAGAIIIGKCNMDEFAFGGTTENDHYGITHNPWDVSRSPGGSSGGSAVAVASRMVFGSLGTDTAASVRNPAHFCGIVGLKPSYGRVSNSGVVPLAWSLDHVGPFTRTVKDSAIMLQAISGYDPKDSYSSRNNVDDYTKNIDNPISNIKIGILKDYFWDPIEPSVNDAVEKAVDVLTDLGSKVQNVTFDSAHLFPILMNTVLPAEAAAYHKQWLETKQNDYGQKILDRILPGLTVSGPDYINAQRIRDHLKTGFMQMFEPFDVLICPTVPYTAAKIGQLEVVVGESKMEASVARTKNLFPFNALGLPAISIPCGFDQNNMPIGFQIIGKPFEESKLLQVGNNYQKSTNWHLMSPIIE